MWIHLLTKLAWDVPYFHSLQPEQQERRRKPETKGRLTSSVAKSNQTIRSMVRPGSQRVDVGSWTQQGMLAGQAVPTALISVPKGKGDCLQHPEVVLRPHSHTYRGGCSLTHILIYSFSCSLGRIMKTITSSFGSTGDKYLEKKIDASHKRSSEELCNTLEITH